MNQDAIKKILAKLDDMLDTSASKHGTTSMLLQQYRELASELRPIIATLAEVTEHPKPDLDVEAEALVTILRSFGNAYPEDMFPPMSPEEINTLRETHPGYIDRISAGMGRHLSKIMAEAADKIEQLALTPKQ